MSHLRFHEIGETDLPPSIKTKQNTARSVCYVFYLRYIWTIICHKNNTEQTTLGQAIHN